MPLKPMNLPTPDGHRMATSPSPSPSHGEHGGKATMPSPMTWAFRAYENGSGSSDPYPWDKNGSW